MSCPHKACHRCDHPNENNTQAYVSLVSSYSGIDADAPQKCKKAGDYSQEGKGDDSLFCEQRR